MPIWQRDGGGLEASAVTLFWHGAELVLPRLGDLVLTGQATGSAG